MTHSEIRSSGFWIIGGPSNISNFTAKCTRCRKLRGPLQEQKMVDLPKDRVQPAPPFSYCAVNYFGPWYVKEGRRQVKRYGVLFTCLASRAVHLEVANSLTADSFINVYRRPSLDDEGQFARSIQIKEPTLLEPEISFTSPSQSTKTTKSDRSF